MASSKQDSGRTQMQTCIMIPFLFYPLSSASKAGSIIAHMHAHAHTHTHARTWMPTCTHAARALNGVCVCVVTLTDSADSESRADEASAAPAAASSERAERLQVSHGLSFP